ncbi:hypothetical protein AALP_AA8G019000 [Arabis alpina]|uniref:protein-serine/threonine phosphatase n=1 Tax=Arabis alpina TaxID=50452 RepID=A0A087G4E3_ARAAL|nr:hypothetical protein AALP_AA8G019000 [Arabis alpina]
MGNGFTTLTACCTGTITGEISHRYDVSLIHDGLGHSFCYITPETTTPFRSISGASVSANPSTALSGAPPSDSDYSSAVFESSGNNFASLPLMPVPRGSTWQSGPIINESGHGSAPFERRFMSGPIESGLYSGPIESTTNKITKPEKTKSKKKNNFLTFKALFTNIISNNNTKPKKKKNVIEPITGSDSPESGYHIPEIIHETLKSDQEAEEEQSNDSVLDIQWAQGKAGEDRVHVVVSEENGWVFVGIYDGFSGPDAPDYLLNNLYIAVQKELNGLLCNQESDEVASSASNLEKSVKWKCEWENCNDSNKKTESCDDHKGTDSTRRNHRDVLKALLQALRKTEEAYLELADMMVKENPELALMGSCVLVTLMKGEDIYVMNVGDSRAVLARAVGRKKRQKELGRIKEDSSLEDKEMLMNRAMRNSLVPLQLNMEHSTRIEEEVMRIKKEHPEDDCAVENDRVKGYLKVTRAFGAGFLKQPKWNDALLEMFRIDYIGTSPYITCSPSLCHHKLTSRDKFLILSSDGLYEYFSNEEAIFEVESFISAFPEGDPAQHLIQEVLLRAANKFGMDFHELLEIPQGDRRRYHDDISVIVISLEGRIWRSSM